MTLLVEYKPVTRPRRVYKLYIQYFVNELAKLLMTFIAVKAFLLEWVSGRACSMRSAMKKHKIW